MKLLINYRGNEPDVGFLDNVQAQLSPHGFLNRSHRSLESLSFSTYLIQSDYLQSGLYCSTALAMALSGVCYRFGCRSGQCTTHSPTDLPLAGSRTPTCDWLGVFTTVECGYKWRLDIEYLQFMSRTSFTCLPVLAVNWILNRNEVSSLSI